MSHHEINNPKHYDLFADGTQAINVIEAALTPEELVGYLKGSALKYRLRAGEKGEAQKCLAKANWYRARLAEVLAQQGALHRAPADRPAPCPAALAVQAAAALALEQEAERYRGQGGVMIRCPGCAGGCECLA